MKIAVLDPTRSEYAGGVQTYVRGVVKGFRDSSDEVTHLRWKRFQRVSGVTRVPRDLGDAADLLNDHDLVYVVDSAFYDHDHEAWKTGGRPEYVDLLDRIKTNLIVRQHASFEKHKYLRQRDVLNHPNVTAIILHDRRDLMGEEVTNPVVEMHLLPYVPFDDDVRRNFRNELVEGCFTTNRLGRRKGHRELVDSLYDSDIDLDIMGVMFTPGTTTASQRLWLRLVEQHGCEPLYPEDTPLKTEEWSVRTLWSGHVRYRGGYVEPHAPYVRLNKRAHVNLTHDCTHGHLEYTTLEAIDAGRTTVVHTEMGDRQGDTYGYLPSMLVDAKNPDDIKKILKRASSQFTSRVVRDDIMKQHDPKTYIEKILREVA